MIKINDNLSIDFVIHGDKKAVMLKFTKEDCFFIYDSTFENIVKCFFKHKAEIGDYPILKQSSNSETDLLPKIDHK